MSALIDPDWPLCHALVQRPLILCQLIVLRTGHLGRELTQHLWLRSVKGVMICLACLTYWSWWIYRHPSRPLSMECVCVCVCMCGGGSSVVKTVNCIQGENIKIWLNQILWAKICISYFHHSYYLNWLWVVPCKGLIRPYNRTYLVYSFCFLSPSEYL